jgi:hypothetical protein
MINNRPEILESLPFYKHLPRAPFTFNPMTLPPLLNFDIFEMCGILPITLAISNLCPEGLSVQPSKNVFDYYQKIAMKFQMIFVVASFYDLKFVNETIIGRPYAISLIPASKREKVDERNAKFAASLKYEELENMGLIYLDYDPFEGAYGLFGSINILMRETGLHTYTDSIGFVINCFLLATKYEKNDVLLSNINSSNKLLQTKYRKYRINRYFKSFTDIRPRKIWGADSPIELFLIQGLAAEGFFPTIQTQIFDNGDIFPSFHQMIESGHLVKDNHLISEVDLFFPENKVAIFCDSTRHHRSPRAKQKDTKIDERLMKLGIKPIRVKGSDIVNHLGKTIANIMQAL